MKKLHYSYTVWIIVCFIHFVVFLIPSFVSSPLKKEKKSKIIVRSFNQSPPPESIPGVKSHKPKEIKTASTTSTPVKPSKMTPPPSTKEKIEQPIIKTPKNAKQLKAKKLLSKLDKNLEMLQQKELPKTELSLPKPIQLPSIETSDELSEEIVDCTALFSFFQNNLQLPEKGEIKVSITVQPNGKIDNIQIIHTKSTQNAAYLKEELPKLHLPKLVDKPTMLTVVFREET